MGWNPPAQGQNPYYSPLMETLTYLKDLSEGAALDASTQYNVKPTNSAATNTTQLAAALAAANTFGLDVLLPPGTIQVNTVQVPVPAQRKGILIRGHGTGRTILQSATTVGLLVVGDGGALDAQHITVQDLSLDGNGLGTVGVRLNHTRFAEFRRIDMQNFSTACVDVVGGVSNYFPLFSHCRFFNSGTLVQIDGGSGVGGNSGYIEYCHFGAATGSHNGVSSVAVAVNGGDSWIIGPGNEFNGTLGVGVYLYANAAGNKVLFNQFDGPTTAVRDDTALLNHIYGNTGGGAYTYGSSLSSSLFFGEEAGVGGNLLYGRAGLVIGGPDMPTGTTTLRVRAPASQSTDVLRVENSAATALFRVDQAGNIETGSAGVITAHGHSTFNNAGSNSISVTVTAGVNPSAKVLRLQGAAAHTADLVSFEDNNGTVLGGIGPKGTVRAAKFTTAGRPAAATAGQGAMYYDTTLSKPAWSDGTVWRDSAGTAV